MSDPRAFGRVVFPMDEIKVLIRWFRAEPGSAWRGRRFRRRSWWKSRRWSTTENIWVSSPAVRSVWRRPSTRSLRDTRTFCLEKDAIVTRTNAGWKSSDDSVSSLRMRSVGFVRLVSYWQEMLLSLQKMSGASVFFLGDVKITTTHRPYVLGNRRNTCRNDCNRRRRGSCLELDTRISCFGLRAVKKFVCDSSVWQCQICRARNHFQITTYGWWGPIYWSSSQTPRLGHLTVALRCFTCKLWNFSVDSFQIVENTLHYSRN